MFDLNCEPAEASIKTNPDGGITYSVICKSVTDEVLARLMQAAQSGEDVRVVFGDRSVTLADVVVEPLAAGAVYVAGRLQQSGATE
jgi:hypothetical protein